MDQQDLARDNSGTRGYAGFISELSDLIPDAILPSISLLLIHLDGEVCRKMRIIKKNFNQVWT